IFPFIGKEEAAFQDFAARELGLACLSGDDVLSGRGLRLLHLFLTGERREAHEIAAEALGSETGTLRWYARFYARACRNWALSTLCTGGLFITGGIALRNPLVTECAAFREAFYEGPHRRLLERIPVRRFTDMNSGLWGSAWFGMRMTA
ncbi:MAG: glucokinase, partial [Bilophila wadsworthia]